MKRPTVSQWYPYHPPAASTRAAAMPISIRLRRLRVAAGFAAVELSFTPVSGRRAVGKSALVCPIFPGLLSSLLASESKPSSKALAARCAALAPRAPTTRAERLETSSFLIRCGCMVRSKLLTERFGQHMFGAATCQRFFDRTVRSQKHDKNPHRGAESALESAFRRSARDG